MVPTLIDDLAELKQWLLLEQYELKICSCKGYTEITGTYFVQASDKQVSASGPLARFEVCFKIYNNHPYVTPELRETGGLIKNISGNHLNPNGTLCYGPPKFVWASNPNMTLVRFFKEYIHSYFMGYLYFQEHGNWPQGEYEHGGPGVLTAYSELLKCKQDFHSILGMLKLLSLKFRRDRWPCPCMSGKRLGDCCRPTLNSAGRKINREVAEKLLNVFSSDYHL